MTGFAKLLLALAAAVATFGCAGVEPGFETPTVRVSSFRLLPTTGMAPRFEIGLHIVNPNRTALTLEGIVYTVTLEGHRILTGVARDLPVIGAYGEGELNLTATTNLLSSINLFAALMNHPRESIAYELEAKLDIGGLRPRILVREAGRMTLGGEDQN